MLGFNLSKRGLGHYKVFLNIFKPSKENFFDIIDAIERHDFVSLMNFLIQFFSFKLIVFNISRGFSLN